MAAKPMSKTKTVSHIAEKLSTSKKNAALFFEELFKLAVKEAKGAAGKFVIPGIGRVVKAHRKARMGRNPQTGEAIKIKAKTVVRLRPSKALTSLIWFPSSVSFMGGISESPFSIHVLSDSSVILLPFTVNVPRLYIPFRPGPIFFASLSA